MAQVQKFEIDDVTMNSELQDRSILVISPSSQALESLRKKADEQKINVLIAHTSNLALEVMKNMQKSLTAVYVCSGLKEPHPILMIKEVKMRNPSIPVFLIENENANPILLNADDIQRIGIEQVVRDPLKSMKALVKHIHGIIDVSKIKNPESQMTVAVEEVKDSGEAAYFAVRALDFLSGARTLFDVYVKLGREKVIKVLRAGDDFSVDRVMTYLEKGVEFFYISREDRRTYTKHCEEIVKRLQSQKDVPREVRLTQSLSFGESAMALIKSVGLTEENFDFGTKYVEAIVKQANSLRALDTVSPLKRMIEIAKVYDHSAAVAFYAILLGKEFESPTEEQLTNLGMAAFFHDIGLGSLPDSVWHEDERLMTIDQRRLFRLHPETSVQMLSPFRHRLDVKALEAIHQHHMRRGMKGFPAQDGVQQISPMAEIIGICSEFHHLLQEKIWIKDYKIVEILQARVFPGFSKQIVSSFKKVFLKD